MICYRCGEEMGRKIACTNCGADLRMFHRVKKISNLYYNDGLEKANVRNLSGAIISLCKSLKFNKYNTDARNLLGLVYYEMGEVVDALGEWVISVNHQPEDNVASRYLESIHNNRSQLDAINQTIKKYNQALVYCQQNSRDLAIIQLKKVLSLNSKLVKGHQLLALLYIQEGQYEKAKRSLRNAGKIDTDNTLTLKYLKEVNNYLKTKGKSKKPKNDDLISYRSGNETIIVPNKFGESSVGSTLVYIVIGLIIGAAVTSWLIVPNIRNNANEDAKSKLIAANETITTNEQNISKLESQIEDLQKELDEAENSNEEVKIQISTFEQLLEAYQVYTQGDVLETGKKLEDIDATYLSKSAKKIYKSLNELIYDDYMKAIYKEGYYYY